MVARVGGWRCAVTAAFTFALVLAVPSAQARPHIDSPIYSFGELQAEEAAIVGVQVTAVDEPTTIESVELLDPSSPFWIESEDCIGDPMGVNDVCHIAVIFLAPDADGSFQDTLRIQAADGTTATSVVQGSSYRAGGLTADPARVDWDGLSIGRRNVVLRNRTTEALWIDSVVATLGFSVRNQWPSGCSEELLPGDTCSMSVLPPSSRAGTSAGMLTVRHAAADGAYPGPFTPIPPYSILSVPLSRAPWTYVPRPAPPRLTPRDYDPIKGKLAKLSRSIPRLVRGGPSRSLSLPALRAPVNGRLSLVLHGWRHGKRVWLGGGDHTFEFAGRGRLRFRLNKNGVALLRRSKRTRVKVVLEFSPGDDGKDVRQASHRVVKPPLKKKVERR
jgi:hypothetical protein